MIKLLSIVTFVVIFICKSVYASDSMKNFQNKLEKIMHNSTGSSAVFVVRNGYVFKALSKGVKSNTQFYIGSLSKNMTAYMLLVSLHEKYPQISLQELLNKKLTILFPYSVLLKSIDKTWVSKVSLLDLLTHKSGLTDYLDNYSDGQKIIAEALNKPISATELLQSISFNPAKKYLYSNSNYLLIGKLIEELNGDSLDHLFDRLIKLPTRMQSSFCLVSGNYLALKKLPYCTHLAPNLNEKIFVDMTNAIGAGSVISTSDDLIKWGTYLFKSAPKMIVETMLQNYGIDSEGDVINLGLVTQVTTHLGDFIGHQGAIDSYKSFLGYAPKSDTLIIILSNNNTDANQLMESLINWLAEPEEKIRDN